MEDIINHLVSIHPPLQHKVDELYKYWEGSPPETIAMAEIGYFIAQNIKNIGSVEISNISKYIEYIIKEGDDKSKELVYVGLIEGMAGIKWESEALWISVLAILGNGAKIHALRWADGL